jgi:hypothetical protein
MELLLIPILFLTGASLLLFSVNGLPVQPRPMQRSTVAGPSPERQGLAWQSNARPENKIATLRTKPARGGFEPADALLAELLAEMIGFRSDLAEIKTKLDALIAVTPATNLTAEPSPATTTTTRGKRRAKLSA